jgi:hypothetical protein
MQNSTQNWLKQFKECPEFPNRIIVDSCKILQAWEVPEEIIRAYLLAVSSTEASQRGSSVVQRIYRAIRHHNDFSETDEDIKICVFAYYREVEEEYKIRCIIPSFAVREKIDKKIVWALS